MTNREKFKTFLKEFKPELVSKFTKFIIDTDSFAAYYEAADRLKRSSAEFQNLSSYHIEALKDKKYEKMYREAEEKIMVIRRAMNMDQPEIFLFKKDVI
jgi:hypothetical protein